MSIRLIRTFCHLRTEGDVNQTLFRGHSTNHWCDIAMSFLILLEAIK